MKRQSKPQSLEVFSTASNHAVIQAPGRHFPGSLVQGDSLSNLVSLATDVAAELRNVELEDNDVLYAMQELQEKLLDRLLHYQNVLDEHGVELPYHPRAEATDLVRLTPEIGDDDDSEHAG